jgi:hypothetical protein
VAYALVNRSDLGFATCFAINAACCVAIPAIVWWKQRTHRRPHPDRASCEHSNRSTAADPFCALPWCRAAGGANSVDCGL